MEQLILVLREMGPSGVVAVFLAVFVIGSVGYFIGRIDEHEDAKHANENASRLIITSSGARLTRSKDQKQPRLILLDGDKKGGGDAA